MLLLVKGSYSLVVRSPAEVVSVESDIPAWACVVTWASTVKSPSVKRSRV